MGIEHALLPEQGLVTAGDCVIGADSHTCTYGALGAFSTGVGSTDMAAGMATGECWFKVPSAIRFELTGRLPKNCSGKDVILMIIGMIGVDGALYKSMEFTGEGVGSLSMDDRFTICNMAIEAGAKNGIFPVDDKTLEYIDSVKAALTVTDGEKQRVVNSVNAHEAGQSDDINEKSKDSCCNGCSANAHGYTVYSADADAEYERTVTIDLSKIVPTVACPHLPSNTRPAAELKSIKIDQVVIGSCTNGRLSDMEAAYNILNGRQVAQGVRCIIIPATMKILRECVERGWYTAFIDAGAVVSTPTCGPCLGGYMGILAEGERCVATTNRNFVGRMGHVRSEVYLASPAVAATSAIAGHIEVPD